MNPLVTLALLLTGILSSGVPAVSPGTASRYQTPPPLPVDPVLPSPELWEPGEEGVFPAPGAQLLSLPRAVELALQRNTGILASNDGVNAARFREDASRAQFLPQAVPSYQKAAGNQSLSVDVFQKLPWTGGSITASTTLTSFTNLTVPGGRSTEVHAILTQPLLRGLGPNATFFDLTNSRRSREGQERNAELVRQRVALDVTSAFFQVIKQRQLLSVARQSFKRSDGLRQASEARMKVGLASKLDVFRAELQTQQAQAASIGAETALDTSLEQFRILLGLSPDTPLEPEAVILKEEALEEGPALEELLARARVKRLDLKESQDQIRDSERAASLARQNLLPQLDLNLDLSQLGFGSSFGDAFQQASHKVNLYVSTSYPLQRATENANAAIAELDVDARKRARDELERGILAEVRAALRNLERIRKSVELQRKGIEFATQQRKLATLRYERGLASNFDVVDAEGNLVGARTALVGLLTDYEVARIQLLKATGDLNPATEFSR